MRTDTAVASVARVEGKRVRTPEKSPRGRAGEVAGLAPNLDRVVVL
jgi:hypothetical protein